MEQTYTLDITTIAALMGAGFLMGFMTGKKFMQMRMMLFFILLFIGGAALFLQTSGPQH